MAGITLSPEQIDLAQAATGAMDEPFNIPQAMDDLYDANALASAAKAMHECGDDCWRVLDVLSNRLLTVIKQLDRLQFSMDALKAAGHPAGAD